MRKFALFLFIALCCARVSQAGEKSFEIHAKKFAYSPEVITVNRGDTVRITLKSDDVSHGMYIDGYELVTVSSPGSDGHLNFVADRTGRFAFRCAVTCGEFHPYMIGYLEVEPNFRYMGYTALIAAIGIANIVFIALRRRGVKKNA